MGPLLAYVLTDAAIKIGASALVAPPLGIPAKTAVIYSFTSSLLMQIGLHGVVYARKQTASSEKFENKSPTGEMLKDATILSKSILPLWIASIVGAKLVAGKCASPLKMRQIAILECIRLATNIAFSSSAK